MAVGVADQKDADLTRRVAMGSWEERFTEREDEESLDGAWYYYGHLNVLVKGSDLGVARKPPGTSADPENPRSAGLRPSRKSAGPSAARSTRGAAAHRQELEGLKAEKVAAPEEGRGGARDWGAFAGGRGKDAESSLTGCSCEAAGAGTGADGLDSGAEGAVLPDAVQGADDALPGQLPARLCSRSSRRMGRRWGRLYVDRGEGEIRIIDICAIARGTGVGRIGTGLLGELRDEAGAAGQAAEHSRPEKFNPALRLYLRLGFKVIEDKGVYLLMEWRA